MVFMGETEQREGVVIRLSTLRTEKNNPRKISAESFSRLCASIQEDPEFMVLRPIIVDENNTVIGGNQRIQALLQLGFSEIPEDWVRKATLSEDKRKRFLVVDNAPKGMSGEWDNDILLEQFDVDELIGLGLESELNLEVEVGEEELDEKEEVLRPIKWTRVLLSIPIGATISNIDEVVAEIEKKGGRVDYASN